LGQTAKTANAIDSLDGGSERGICRIFARFFKFFRFTGEVYSYLVAVNSRIKKLEAIYVVLREASHLLSAMSSVTFDDFMAAVAAVAAALASTVKCCC